MENKDELYNEEELELLNKLNIMSKEFKEAYNETKDSNEIQEK